jgi:hypothetical protein
MRVYGQGMHVVMRNSLMDLESGSSNDFTPTTTTIQTSPLMLGFDKKPQNLSDDKSHQCSSSDLLHISFTGESQGCLSREELILLEYLTQSKNKSDEDTMRT